MLIMSEKKYLDEKKYKKTKGILLFIALLIYIVGFSIGGIIIYKNLGFGDMKSIDELKKELEIKKQELISKGITESYDYNNGEAYDLHILNDVLNPNNSFCGTAERNNALTSEYCEKLNRKMHGTMSNIFPGIFVIWTAIILGTPFLLWSRQREILAFQAQQAMPIAQEGLDKMAPNLGNAANKIAKGIRNAGADQISCTNCGGLIDKDSTFCEHCGKKL